MKPKKKMAQEQDKINTENVPFRQEFDEMERNGSLQVWPYRVRRDLTVSQKRLQNARAYVAEQNKPTKDTLDIEAKTSESARMNFMPALTTNLTDAQKTALDIVKRELDAVEAETAKALSEMARRNDELASAQEELRRFAARTRRTQSKLRRELPSKPPPPQLFQASAKVARKRKAKEEEEAMKAKNINEEIKKRDISKRRLREERRMARAERDAKQREEEFESTRFEREEKAKERADEERRLVALKTKALDEAAEASRARKVLVECPGCGIVMELMKLPRHQKEACENRKVPCKNFEFGCSCMVRVRDRRRHEDAGDLINPRACLWFGGPAATNRVVLDEEDIVAPWTAEFWVLRPSVSVAAVGLVTKALGLRQEFRTLFAVMADTKFRVDSLEQALVSNISSTKKTKKEGQVGGGEDQAYIASLLLAANDEYKKFAVRVAALRAGYVDVMSAAGRRLAEADNELEDLEILGRTSHDGFSTKKNLEDALEPLVLRYCLSLRETMLRKDEDDSKQAQGRGGGDDGERNDGEKATVALSNEAGIDAEEDDDEDEEEQDNFDEENDDKEAKKMKETSNEEKEDVPAEVPVDNTVKKMTLPSDWLILCETPRDLITAIKGRALEERSGYDDMFKMMTEGQGQKNRKVVTGKRKKREKPLSDRAKRKLKRKEKAALKRDEKRAAESLGDGLPFGEQITRAVRGRQGRDTVACSENWRLQLEVGDRDEVGVSIPDLGEFTFTDPPPPAGTTTTGGVASPPAIIPRRKWCHVCFVATAKHKLIIYIDGHLVKRVPKEKGSGNSSVASGNTSVTSKGSKGDKEATKLSNKSDNGLDLKLLQTSLGDLRRSELRAKTPGSSQNASRIGSPMSMEAGSVDKAPSVVSAVSSFASAAAVSLGLPMRDIGEASGPGVDPNISLSGPCCFHGAMQEVRYWAVARSAGEVRGCLHKLLDDDAPKHGLAGWWTMEEGKGNFAMDVTEARFRSRLVGLRGKGMKWVESETVAAGQEPPTPAWRERSVCAVELRRVRLAVKGRKLLEPVPCSADCGDMVVRKNMKFHLTYHCRNREVACWLCGRSNLRYSDLSRHLSSGCPAKAQVAALAAVNEANNAPVPCVLCGLEVAKRHLAKHQQNECPERLVDCRYDCGLRIVAHRIKRHEEEWCEAPEIVELRGLAIRSRKLRHYDRDWNLNMADNGDDDDDSDDDSDDSDDDDDDGHGNDDDDSDVEKTPREYVSVRRDPLTLSRMAASGVDVEELV